MPPRGPPRQLPWSRDICQNVSRVHCVLDACLRHSLIVRGSLRGCDLGPHVHHLGWGRLWHSKGALHLRTHLFPPATSVCTESGVQCVYDAEGEQWMALLGSGVLGSPPSPQPLMCPTLPPQPVSAPTTGGTSIRGMSSITPLTARAGASLPAAP